MADPKTAPTFEQRWPVVLAVVVTYALLTALPERLRLVPPWITLLLGSAVIIPMIVVGLTHERNRWLRLEHALTLLFFVAALIGTLATLGNFVRAMVRQPEDISGLALLSSSIAVWVTNVLMFSLLYWQVDRGGPGNRARSAAVWPDWQFPQAEATGQVPPDWRPLFVDYLFLGFSTATAFSMTEALPLTARAKLLMMTESTIALVTIVVVASRAINILGT
ncbi:MAG: hypothetical protein ACYC63_10230 [Armatimonadota bacterium]